MTAKTGMWGSRVAIACAVALGGLLVSCRREVSDSDPSQARGGNVTMEFKGMTRSAVDNTRVWFFNGIGSDRGKFHSKILRIDRPADNKLSMTAPAGTWDIALVATATGSGMGSVIEPTVGQPRETQPMFILKPLDGVLPSAPELLTACIPGTTVQPNVTNNASATLGRNVAMIRLTIKEPQTLSTTSTQKVTLGNIPTTIAWDGGLLPSATNPTVSDKRMEGVFTITDPVGGAKFQTCSTVIFLVPADKNIATNCKLNVGVEVEYKGGKPYVSPECKTIKYPNGDPIPLKAGQILDVNLVLDAELVADATILPWEDVPLDESKLANPYVEFTVSTAHSSFALEGEVMVSTNGDRPDIIPDPTASWLTTASWKESGWNGAATLRLVGNAETYVGVERSSWVDLKLGNFKKRIEVTQKDDGPGTITVEPEVVVLSPYKEHKTRTITFKAIAGNHPGPFKISTGVTGAELWPLPNVESVSPAVTQTVAAGGKYTLTRKDFPGSVDNGEYGIFGESTLYVRNVKTLEVAKVKVINLYMTAKDFGVEIPKPDGPAEKTTVLSGIEVYGGSGKFTVEPNAAPYTWPEWVKSVSVVENPKAEERAKMPWALSITAIKEYDGKEWVGGKIWIANVDDPDYKIAVNVEPGLIASIPPFNYFVIRHEWLKSGDLDIAFRLYDNTLSSQPAIYDKAVGYATQGNGQAAVMILDDGTIFRCSKKESPYYWPAHDYEKNPLPSGRSPVIEWNGDGASQGGDVRYETVFFNAPTVDAMNSLPRKIKIEIRARWFSGRNENDPARISMWAYKGGTMKATTAYDYVNVGGVNLTPLMGDINSNNIREISKNEWGKYNKEGIETTLVGTLIYDRLMHSAVIKWVPGKAANDPGFPPMGTRAAAAQTRSGEDDPIKNAK